MNIIPFVSSCFIFFAGVGWSSSLLSLVSDWRVGLVVTTASGGVDTILSTSWRPMRSSGLSQTEIRDEGL